MEILLPNAERRMCARHIWANWQKRWRGEERRKAFWRCSKASFEVKLRDEFDYMGKLSHKICEALLDITKNIGVELYLVKDQSVMWWKIICVKHLTHGLLVLDTNL